MLPLALLLTGLALSPALELQPRTYASPSGGWSLRVEPLTRDGTGEADYTLSGGGREAWKKRHAFALWDACVTDDGRVAGYAYVGRDADAPAGGSLHAVVLSPKGEALLDESHEREMSGFMHQPGNPRALGLFVQPELGRFVLRVADEDLNRQAESWWAYDLASGAPLFQERPKLALGHGAAVRNACAVRAIPRTPLVLVQWYRFETSVEPWSIGVVFELLDAERRSVWRLELPHDYESQGDSGTEQRRPWFEWAQRSAIHGTDPGRFELHHVAEGLRVRYAIEAGASGAWAVSESARESYREETPPGPAVGEPIRLALRREVTLAGAARPEPEIRDVLAFGFDAHGRLRFARGERSGATLVQLSENGEVRRATPLTFELGESEEVVWFPLAPPRWLAVRQSWEQGTRARAWLVDEITGARAEIPDFPHHEVERAADLPGDRLVVLGTGGLVAFGANGTLAWRVRGDTEGAPRPLAGQDMAVTSEGKVAVLGNGRDLVQVFSADGEHVDTIDLASAWGKDPNYPSSIVPDRDGGVLIHDFNGEPALWRMGLDGGVRAKLDARMRDGQAREEYRRAARVAPDGRLWTTDGHEFVRLDEQGVADLQLGQPAMLGELQSPGSAMIDSTFARLLVVDDRTRALHVFDGEGQRVLLCRPRPEEVAALRFPLRMLCDSAGGALAAKSRHTNRHLRFGADGESRGVEKLAGVDTVFVPGREAYWSVVHGAPALVGPDGRHHIDIPKLPDGRWWRAIEDLSVSADGSLVVLDLPRSPNGLQREPGEGLVARYDAGGKPLGEHALPETMQPSVLSHAGRWILLSYYGPPAWLIDTRDGSLRPIELGDAVDSKLAVAFGLSPDGRELWALQAEARRLLRFALPD